MRSLFTVAAAATMLLSSGVMAADLTRVSTPVDEQEAIAGNPWLPWAFALVALVAIILVVVDDEDEPQSP